MKLSALRESMILVEMAAKKACPVCGHGMANFHFYRNGGWYCKTTSLKAPAPGANTAACAKALADGIAPRVSGGATPTNASTTAPKTPRVPKAAAPASTPVAPAVSVNYSDLQKKIDKWLIDQEISNYTINDDNTVSVDGDLELIGLRYKQLPVTFKEVTGDIKITGGMLANLQGLPKEINGHLSIASADNITLIGAPRRVGGLDIHGTILTTFTSSPIREITGDVTLTAMNLTNLMGLPAEISGSLTINSNYEGRLKSLDGCPQTVGKHFKLMRIEGGGLINAKSLPTHIGGSVIIDGDITLKSPNFSAFGKGGLAINVPCTGTIKLPNVINGNFKYKLTNERDVTLESLPSEINGAMEIPAYMLAEFPKIHQTLKRVNGPILITDVINYGYNGNTAKMESNGELRLGPILGLLQIKGVTKIELSPPKAAEVQKIQSIIDRVFAGDVDVYEAQDLLIDAGYSKQARL